MKNSKRLLAVLMAVVMILTIVPLGLFAFAEDEDPTPPEPRTEINTIEIDSIAELQLIGNDDAYPVEPTKYTAEDGAEVTVNYVYKITKDLSAADESFDAWFASNEETARATFDKYVVVPEGITEIPEGAQYYVKNGDEYVAVDMTTVEKPVAADTYYTFEPRADFDTEALKSTEKSTLIEKYNISQEVEFTPIALLNGVTIDGAYAEGKTAIISGLKIGSVTKDDVTYAGLIAATYGATIIKDVKLDATCSISAIGNGDVRVGSFVAYAAALRLENVSSAANIEVSNKLYGPKSSENTANKYVTSVGGLIGSGSVLLDIVTNSSFTGKIDFTYDNDSFADVDLKDVYDKTNIRMGGLVGTSAVIDKNSKADGAVMTSTYLGTTVKAGILRSADNDYTLLAAYTKDAQTYPDNTDGYKKADIFGAAQTEENQPDANGYQLIKATDTESGTTYAYIRTPICAHTSDPIVTTEKPATCKEDGNIAYCQCPDCERYFEGNSYGTEIALADTVISKDTIAHTITHIAATDAKCETTGNSEYWKCSVCDKCFSDAEGTTEAQESSFTIAALGHAWDEGTVTKEPTYDEAGTKEFICTREGCDKTKTEEIPKLVPPTVTPKSSSGYKATKTGSLNTIILPNPSNKAGTTVASFKSNLESGYTYIVKDSKGNTVTSGPVGTKFTVEISGYPSTKVTVIVRGDTDCNGSISSMDYVKIKNHIRGTSKITDAIIQVAADANNDGKLNATDYVRVKNVIRNSK